MVVDAIPTGSLALDAALGIGGVPRGRIIEVYGPESSGKTTLALHILAEAQKRGGEVAFVDAGARLGPRVCRRFGVDIDSMLVSQPDTGEQALEIADALVRSGAVDAVVVDSVAALTPGQKLRGNGRQLCGSPGPAHVPGAAEAGRLHRQDQLRGDLHQSAADEDWRQYGNPRPPPAATP